MSMTERTITLVRHPLRFRRLEVRRVTRLTPRMVRVTLGGDDLDGFTSASPDDHVRLFFPPDGEIEPVLPAMTDRGPVYPEGALRPQSRDYTPRRFNADARELDVDMVIHGAGPGSSWASRAAPGMIVGVGGPRGSLVVPTTFDWYLLAGDESALPAIGRRLEELPAGSRAFAFVEVADAAEQQPIESRADVSLTWLHRNGAPAGSTRLLDRAVSGLEFPEGDFYAWAAGEATIMRRLREHLLNERSARQEWMRVAGYWKHGSADHHEPHED